MTASNTQHIMLTLNHAVEKMAADIEEIKETLRAFDDRLRALERKEDAIHPVLEKQLLQVCKYIDDHEIKFNELSKAVLRLEQSHRLLAWISGIVGSTVVIWIIQQLLQMMK